MNLSYNISQNIKNNLTKIEELRRDILVYPLSPKNELRIKWDFVLEKIIWSLALTDSPLTKNDIVKLLTSRAPKKKITNHEGEVLNQKNAFDYIKAYWTVSENLVDMHLVKKLYDLSCRDYYGKMSGLTDYSEKRITTVFEYLQNGKDHPIIQAGIIQPEIFSIKPFDYGNGKVARLLSYVYLYRSGYDFRGMLNMEEYYKRDVVTYDRMVDMAHVQGNMTAWLEYFTYGVKTQLEKSLDIIKHLKFQEEIKLGFWKLNSRQQEVLEILENPNGRVTNKDVQKLCGVSQITSSRDLARLVSLGLLLSHGKGRSVYYTRV